MDKLLKLILKKRPLKGILYPTLNYSSEVFLLKETLVGLLRTALVIRVLDVPKHELVLNVRNLGVVLGLGSFS